MPHAKTLTTLAGVLAVLAGPLSAAADVASVAVHRRVPFAEGASFGNTGPYEKITGVVRFAVDPAHPRNKAIVDLEFAPRNAEGKVEFEADFLILTPRDPARGNRAILYEVNNRGRVLAVRAFNGGPGGNDPSTRADAGDGFLFRRGYTLVWCGWIAELVPRQLGLLMRVPRAARDGKPIRGVVRQETVVNSPAERAYLSRRDYVGSYPPTEQGEKEATLTWRMRETDPRVPIPRAQWSLERRPIPEAGRRVAGTLPPIVLRVAGGLRPGYLYELIYESEGPLVQGLGYAAVRDWVSFLRYDTSGRNPLGTLEGNPVITRAHAFGISQAGRFLRNYLYLDFNTDESGRKVFDGLFPHVAGGGLGFFNHRFAQPSRYNEQHEDHLYPCDRFPFAYGPDRDPFSGRTDSVQRRTAARNPDHLPRVFHTQSMSEYWERSGSLVHTDPMGKRDVEIPENVRIYAIGGTQHGGVRDPAMRDYSENPPNWVSPRPILKALLDALDLWVRAGTAPPPSVYPRIDRGTLVGWDRNSTGFPAIPAVRYPQVIQRPHALDFGPQFASRGIITVEPPRIRGDYVVRVPKSDADGNDLGTLLPPEVAVPVATCTGWNLRGRRIGAEGMLSELMGSYLPFPSTRAGRLKRGDPRRSLEERYGNFEGFRRRFAAVCEQYVTQRFLLKEDVGRLLEECEKFRGRFGAAKD